MALCAASMLLLGCLAGCSTTPQNSQEQGNPVIKEEISQPLGGSEALGNSEDSSALSAADKEKMFAPYEQYGMTYDAVKDELTYNGNIYDHECYYIPNIARPTEQDYDELIQLWEKSVRTTHHFLTEESIQFYKPLIRNHYLPAVELFIIRNSHGKIAAFMGLSDELIEMLFVHPDEQGKGYGKRLIEYAIRQKQIDKVDVNEDNDQALRFYQHLGFQVIGRDETDSSNKPFPILHLQATLP